jgi:hypothetical protein
MKEHNKIIKGDMDDFERLEALTDLQDKILNDIGESTDRHTWKRVLSLLEVTRHLDCLEFGVDYDG